MKHKLPTFLKARLFKATVTVFAVAALLGACGGGDSPVTSTTGTVSIGVGLTPNLSSLGNGGTDNPVGVGAVTAIQLTSAKVIISRIRVKSIGEDTLDFNSSAPIVVDLSLAGGEQNLGVLSLPAGAYDETRFRIKKLDSLDGSVFTGNPDMQNVSIRLSGYINGFADSTFTWSSSLNEEQVFKHLTPFTVNGGQTTALSFQFDNSQWFIDKSGATLDPRSAANNSQIESNIKSAFDIKANNPGIL